MAKKQLYKVVAPAIYLPSGKVITKGIAGAADEFEGEVKDLLNKGYVELYEVDEGTPQNLTSELELANVRARQAEDKVQDLESALKKAMDANEELATKLDVQSKELAALKAKPGKDAKPQEGS